MVQKLWKIDNYYVFLLYSNCIKSTDSGQLAISGMFFQYFPQRYLVQTWFKINLTAETLSEFQHFIWKKLPVLHQISQNAYFVMIACFPSFSKETWMYNRSRMSRPLSMYSWKMSKSLLHHYLWSQCWMQGDQTSSNLLLQTRLWGRSISYLWRT